MLGQSTARSCWIGGNPRSTEGFKTGTNNFIFALASSVSPPVLHLFFGLFDLVCCWVCVSLFITFMSFQSFAWVQSPSHGSISHFPSFVGLALSFFLAPSLPPSCGPLFFFFFFFFSSFSFCRLSEDFCNFYFLYQGSSLQKRHSRKGSMKIRRKERTEKEKRGKKKKKGRKERKRKTANQPCERRVQGWGPWIVICGFCLMHILLFLHFPLGCIRTIPTCPRSSPPPSCCVYPHAHAHAPSHPLAVISTGPWYSGWRDEQARRSPGGIHAGVGSGQASDLRVFGAHDAATSLQTSRAAKFRAAGDGWSAAGPCDWPARIGWGGACRPPSPPRPRP